MSLAKVNEEWVPLQIKVFTRWVKSQLKGDNELVIEDITKDLSNGVALVELAKVLTQKKLERQWIPNPKRNIDMVQNCDLAIDMFEKDGVRLVGISGKDINDNNTKLILGLIWSLILHYSIGKSIDLEANNNSQIQNTSKSQKDALMSWAIERTSHYPYIKNFAPYDLSICALLDSYFPEKINYYSLNPNETEHNSKLATQVMDEIGIPVYIYPEDIQNQESKVDDKTLLTQLSTAKVILDQKSSKDSTNSNVQERSVNVDQKFDNLDDANNEIERLRKELAQSQAKVEELTKINNEIEDEKFALERDFAKMSQEMRDVEKQNKDDDELLQKLSIELTEEEYTKMEESDQNEINERGVHLEKDGNNLFDKIVNNTKTIVLNVIQNLQDIDDNIVVDEDIDTNNNDNDKQNPDDTYSLSILDAENSRFLV